MTRSVYALAALFLAFAVLAAPAPEPFVSGWGKPVDPSRDCKIRREKGSLVIEMPGTDHDYDTLRERMNAPRVVRDFEGDFDLQLRVQIDCRPSSKSGVKGQPSFVAGGFLVVPPDSFPTIFMRYQYGVAGEGPGTDGSVSELSRDVKGGYGKGVYDKSWGKWMFKTKPEYVYLRLERKAILLLCKISPDRKEWVTVGGANYIGLPPKLKVGLAAFSTSTDPSKVVFDQLKIIQGKKWERLDFVSGWGNPVDPDKDCKIQRDKDTLTIEMPGTNHDYNPYCKRFNAPRLLSGLKGDFDVQVRVRIDSRPSAQSTVKGQPSFVSAGFLLIYPETGNTICERMEYAVARQGIRVDGYAPMLAEPRRNDPVPRTTEAECYAVKKRWVSLRGMPEQVADICKQQATDGFLWERRWRYWPLPEKADCAYLRLEQRGEWLNSSISPDGHKWTSLTCEKGLPAKGKLGLAAFSTSTEPSKVRFDQLKLARSKKKE